MRLLRWLRSLGRKFDDWVDQLDVYAPGSRVSDHKEKGNKKSG